MRITQSLRALCSLFILTTVLALSAAAEESIAQPCSGHLYHGTNQARPKFAVVRFPLDSPIPVTILLFDSAENRIADLEFEIENGQPVAASIIFQLGSKKVADGIVAHIEYTEKLEGKRLKQCLKRFELEGGKLSFELKGLGMDQGRKARTNWHIVASELRYVPY